jgi:predicted metal-binding membrane protein
VHHAAHDPLLMNQKSRLEMLIRRDKLWVALGLATAIGLAWAYLLREAAAMNTMAAEARMHAAMGMATMTMRTWGLSDWLALLIMWTVMMAGMMLPSAAPVILLVLGAYRLRHEAHPRAAAFAFMGGYLLVWTGFSAAASLGQIALHRAAVLSEEMQLYSATVSGVILLVAGVYQWLPLKNVCLVRCQTPLAFLTRHWRRGIDGGFSMGARHGAYCVGCCWLLMVVLFVVGVMNIVWIAVLAALVLLEKLTPGGAIAGRIAGVAAAGWGLYLLGPWSLGLRP